MNPWHEEFGLLMNILEEAGYIVLAQERLKNGAGFSTGEIKLVIYPRKDVLPEKKL